MKEKESTVQLIYELDRLATEYESCPDIPDGNSFTLSELYVRLMDYLVERRKNSSSAVNLGDDLEQDYNDYVKSKVQND